MVGRDGFEPSKSSTTDLQSAPFGHSGLSPYFISNMVPTERLEPPTYWLQISCAANCAMSAWNASIIIQARGGFVKSFFESFKKTFSTADSYIILLPIRFGKRQFGRKKDFHISREINRYPDPPDIFPVFSLPSAGHYQWILHGVPAALQFPDSFFLPNNR